MPRGSTVPLKKTPPAGNGAARALARAPAAGSLSIQVTEHIRTAIQDGEFKLGEALSELKLAAALGVSRTPVREALNVLQLQGLIEIRPQAGSFVFMPSEEDVAEICLFRRLMETAALRLSFARRREETIRQLREAVRTMERAQDSGDRLAMARGDTAFHQSIAENCGNVYLINAYGLISGRIAALRTYNVVTTGRSKAMSEHRAIVAALAKGDLERAESILDDHVSRMRNVYLAARRIDAGTVAMTARGN